MSWFGQVPSHWSVKRVRYIGTLKGGAGFPHEQQGRKEGELPFFKVKDLGDVAMPLVSTDNYVSRETAADLRASVFPERTIVFAKVGAALLLNRFRILGTPGCIDNNMMGLTVDERVMTVPFALSVLALIDFKIVANPGAVPSVNEDQVSNFSLPVPPLNEQLAISDFLDRETTRLDALVTAKQRVLDLLAEKRKAIIATAVTRGLDPKVKLRDSGVPWLGDIPAHWELWKAGHLAKVGNGSTPERDNVAYWSEGSFPWLNSSVVNRDEVTSSDQFVTDAALRECHLPRLRPGTVLVAITGQGKTRGQAVVLSIQATINQHMAFVAPDPALIDTWFLRWALYRAYDYLRSISDDAGGTKGALTCEDVASLRIPVPPPTEQRTIVKHIARETTKLDAMRAATERTIALLKERRSALIAAAVTGQLDVGAAA